MADLGIETFPRIQQTPEKAEIEKWWPIIKAAGINAQSTKAVRRTKSCGPDARSPAPERMAVRVTGGRRTMSAATTAFLRSGRRMRATVAPPTAVNRASDWRRNLIKCGRWCRRPWHLQWATRNHRPLFEEEELR
jgi:hypothetical protein